MKQHSNLSRYWKNLDDVNTTDSECIACSIQQGPHIHTASTESNAESNAESKKRTVQQTKKAIRYCVQQIQQVTHILPAQKIQKA